jgi:hypothetical protein
VEESGGEEAMSMTLGQWRTRIKREAPYVDVKPYSHNIISLVLSAIAKEYGQAEANRAIEDFGLEELGWNKVEEVKS